MPTERFVANSGGMRRIGVRCVLLAAATLTGCTVGPELQRPEVKPPGAWSPAATRAFDDGLASRVTAQPVDGRQWWLVFGDPTLDRLIERAAAENLDLQQTTLRIAQARAQRDGVAGQRYPNVEGSGIAGRSRMSENGIGKALAGGGSSSGSGSAAGGTSGGAAAAQSAAPPSTFNLFQAGFDATWELDLFGKVRRSIESADADVRAAEAARADALVSLAAEIARDYLNLRGSERQREIALADLATASRLQALVASRNRSGLAPSSDVAAQDAQVDAARAQLPSLEQSIAQSTNRLALAAVDAARRRRRRPRPRFGRSSCHPTFRSAWPATCCADARTSASARPSSRRRRRASAWPGHRSFPASDSASPAACSRPRHRACSTGRRGSCSAARSFRCRSSKGAGSRPRCASPICRPSRRRSPIGRRCCPPSTTSTTRWSPTPPSSAGSPPCSSSSTRPGAVATLADARYRSGLAAYIDVLDATRREHDAEQALSQSTVTASTNLVALFKALGGGWDDTAVAAR